MKEKEVSLEQLLLILDEESELFLFGYQEINNLQVISISDNSWKKM